MNRITIAVFALALTTAFSHTPALAKSRRTRHRSPRFARCTSARGGRLEKVLHCPRAPAPQTTTLRRTLRRIHERKRGEAIVALYAEVIRLVDVNASETELQAEYQDDEK